MLRRQIETRKCYMDWLNNYSMLSPNRKVAMLWLMGLVRAACVSSWLRGPSICSGTAGSTSLDQVDRARSRCPLFVFVQNQKKEYGILGWWLGRLVFSDKCEHLEHPLIIPRS